MRTTEQPRSARRMREVEGSAHVGVRSPQEPPSTRSRERNDDYFILEARVWVDDFAARSGRDVTLEQITLWGRQFEELYETLSCGGRAGRARFPRRRGEHGTGHVMVTGEFDSYKG